MELLDSRWRGPFYGGMLSGDLDHYLRQPISEGKPRIVGGHGLQSLSCIGSIRQS